MVFNKTLSFFKQEFVKSIVALIDVNQVFSFFMIRTFPITFIEKSHRSNDLLYSNSGYLEYRSKLGKKLVILPKNKPVPSW
jgi:hypothetical protein